MVSPGVWPDGICKLVINGEYKPDAYCQYLTKVRDQTLRVISAVACGSYSWVCSAGFPISLFLLLGPLFIQEISPPLQVNLVGLTSHSI